MSAPVRKREIFGWCMESLRQCDVVVANLKPRPLKGIESRGMILTAGKGGKDLVLLDPGDVPPGAEVK